MNKCQSAEEITLKKKKKRKREKEKKKSEKKMHPLSGCCIQALAFGDGESV